MNTFIGLLQLLVVCGTGLTLAIMILASMPSSRFRNVTKQVVHWLIAAFAGLYVISPVDLMPEIILGPVGALDDLVALVACILSIRSALLSGKGNVPTPTR